MGKRMVRLFRWKDLSRILVLTVLTAGWMQPGVAMETIKPKPVSVESIREENGIRLSVMTYNIRHARGLDGSVDLDAVIRDIRDAGADIVGLQEVDRFNVRSGMGDQVRLMGEALDMSWSYAPAFGFGWFQYGNAVLSRYPVESSRMTVLPGFRERRNVLHVTIRAGGRTLHVWNTHLGVMEAERERQMPVLLKALSEWQGPALLLGDFNMDADHRLIRELSGEWHRLDIPGNTLLGKWRVDHIFANEPVRIIKGRVWPTNASDHLPVVAELEWPVKTSFGQP